MTPRMFSALLKRWEAQEDRGYWRAALITKTLADINRDTKKHPKPYKIEEFMPRKPKQKKQLQTAQQKKAIERINTLLGIGAERGRNR